MPIAELLSESDDDSDNEVKLVEDVVPVVNDDPTLGSAAIEDPVFTPPVHTAMDPTVESAVATEAELDAIDEIVPVADQDSVVEAAVPVDDVITVAEEVVVPGLVDVSVSEGAEEDWEVVELSRSGIGSPTVYTTACQLVCTVASVVDVMLIVLFFVAVCFVALLLARRKLCCVSMFACAEFLLFEIMSF